MGNFFDEYKSLDRLCKDILESEIKGTVRISERYIAIEQMIVPEWLRSEVV